MRSISSGEGKAASVAVSGVSLPAARDGDRDGVAQGVEADEPDDVGGRRHGDCRRP